MKKAKPQQEILDLPLEETSKDKSPVEAKVAKKKGLVKATKKELLKYVDKPPEKTLLQIKNENNEAKCYAKVRDAIDNAAKALEIELRELSDKAELTEAEERQRYRETVKHAKIAVRQMEKTNHLHLFLFKSTTGTWWKLGGNSVAIHRLMVGSYLDRDVKVNVDRDNFAVFRDGVICLQDEFRLEKDIAYSGAPLTLDSTIDFGPFAELIRAYRLKVPLSDAEIRRFRNLDQEVMKNIHSNIFAVAPEVELNNYIVAAMRDAYNLERQLDSNARGFVGHPLLDSMFRLRRAYYDVANASRRDPRRYQALEQVDYRIGDAMAVLANYADLGIANRSAIARTSLGLAKAREIARQKVNGYHKKSEIGEKLVDLKTEQAEKKLPLLERGGRDRNDEESEEFQEKRRKL